MSTARWNLVVSQETDDALRRVLAAEGRARKGGLSRFVEDAVRARILEVEAEAAARQRGHGEAEIAGAVDEALEWARSRRLMRVVLDSNVLLSALISPHGAPHRIYEAWRARRFELVTCPTQLDEIRRASRYPKLGATCSSRTGWARW